MFDKFKKIAKEEKIITQDAATCGNNGSCCGQACADCPCQNGGDCMAGCNSNMSCGAGCGCDDTSDYDDTNLSTNASIGEQVDDFYLDCLYENKIRKISLSDYYGKWVILFFYPADFTFVCPTELEDMNDYHAKFQALGAEILSVSTDSAFAHKAWKDSSPVISKVTFPMLSDPTHELAKYYNVLVEETGMARRGTFVIDPDGVLRIVEINDDGIGRNAKELYRKVQAAKFVRENGANVCPAKWEPGEDVITPSIDIVGKI